MTQEEKFFLDRFEDCYGQLLRAQATLAVCCQRKDQADALVEGLQRKLTALLILLQGVRGETLDAVRRNARALLDMEDGIEICFPEVPEA